MTVPGAIVGAALGVRDAMAQPPMLRRRPRKPEPEPRKRGTIYDLSGLYKRARIWTSREKAVLTALRLLAWNEDHDGLRIKPPFLPDRPQGAPPRLLTNPVSHKEIAEMCGRGCSKRTVQRVLAVIGDPAKASVVTIHREKRADGQNEKNSYEIHPDKLFEWAGKERPNGWDPQKKSGGRGSDSAPPPTAYAAALDAARTAAGLPLHDPAVRELAKVAKVADKTAASLARTEGDLVARRQAQAARVGQLLVELAKLTPPTLSADVEPEAASEQLDGDAAPVVEPEDEARASLRARGLLDDEEPVPAEEPAATTEALDAAAEARLVGEILGILVSYPALARRANKADARTIAKKARKVLGFYPIEPVRIALAAFDLKVRAEKYRPDLAAALAFIKAQIPVYRPPVSSLQQGGTWRPNARAPVPVDPPPALADALGAEPTEERTEGEERERAQAELSARPPAEGQAIVALAVEHVRALSPATFDQWFGGIQLEGLAGGVLTLRAHNAFVREWVERNFVPRVTNRLRELTADAVRVEWTVDGDLDAPIIKPVRPALAKRPRPPSRP
jgi:hypothetical protein